MVCHSIPALALGILNDRTGSRRRLAPSASSGLLIGRCRTATAGFAALTPAKITHRAAALAMDFPAVFVLPRGAVPQPPHSAAYLNLHCCNAGRRMRSTQHHRIRLAHTPPRRVGRAAVCLCRYARRGRRSTSGRSLRVNSCTLSRRAARVVRECHCLGYSAALVTLCSVTFSIRTKAKVTGVGLPHFSAAATGHCAFVLRTALQQLTECTVHS